MPVSEGAPFPSQPGEDVLLFLTTQSSFHLPAALSGPDKDSADVRCTCQVHAVLGGL